MPMPNYSSLWILALRRFTCIIQAVYDIFALDYLPLMLSSVKHQFCENKSSVLDLINTNEYS